MSIDCSFYRVGKTENLFFSNQYIFASPPIDREKQAYPALPAIAVTTVSQEHLAYQDSPEREEWMVYPDKMV